MMNGVQGHGEAQSSSKPLDELQAPLEGHPRYVKLRHLNRCLSSAACSSCL